MKLMNAAKQFGVPRATLFDKLHNRTPMKPSARTVLTTHEEECLVHWLKMSARRGRGKARKDLSIVVQKVLNAEGRQTPFKANMPGRKWLHSFSKRHEELRERKTMVLGEQRASLSKEKIQAWFKDVAANLSEDGIDISSVEPGCIFNADETGFPYHISGESE
ncbi:tigger transposable element-derived protein 6-like protein [Plakobranchus ocellatus]|uniref:Tigger transposable element-derived protein 6-like protein n=1 Tax=Plakobranchus ocellatus TaxID=259542 RepID=A0AAV4BEF7_9GAST|nr:tigger transposable element-derived protein 6-like protein [Plakobranchus ocellatus]